MEVISRFLRTDDEKRRLEGRLSKSIDLSSSPPRRRGTVKGSATKNYQESGALLHRSEDLLNSVNVLTRSAEGKK